MHKKQKSGRRFVNLLLLLSSALSSSRIAILFILLIFSLSFSIITMLYISQYQQAMAQTNTITKAPSQATNTTEQNPFLRYENTTYGIKIQYPAGYGWQLSLSSNQTSQDNVLNYIV